MQTSAEKFRETGWEPEREVFFQLQGADRDYEERPDRDPERYEESAFGYGAGGAEEKSTCAWISITAVILCAALCALVVLWSR